MRQKKQMYWLIQPAAAFLRPVSTEQPVLNNNKEQTRLAEKVINNLKPIRDAAILLAAFFYVAGYVVRSGYAYRFNLGFLPAVDSQYFVAGVFPTFVLTAILFWVRAFLRVQARYSNWLDRQPSIWQFALRNGPIYVLAALGLIGLFVDSLRDWLFVLGFIAIFLLTIALPPDPTRKYGKVHGVLLRSLLGQVAYIWPFFGVFAILFFARDIYPRIPQEIGGTQPRCAYFDLVPDALSSETVQAIMPTGVRMSSHAIQRTEKLPVFFSSRDFLLVKQQVLRAGDYETETETYEIGSDAVRAVIWTKC